MIRFYVLPIQVIDGNSRGPKYFLWRLSPDGIGIDAPWSMKDYGLIPAALVAADVTQAQHEQLIAEADVAASPVDIDQNISDIALPKVAAVMEALRIPAGWIDDTYTYRQILRMIGGLFMFAQRYHGMHNEQLIDNVGQLDLTWSQIPTAREQKIIATADDRGYDYSAVQPSWKVRRILKHLGDQWGMQPIYFGRLGEI